MTLSELFKTINDKRLKLELPLINEDRFLEEITIMQLTGQIIIQDGKVFTL